MVRRALQKTRFTFTDARNGTRHDRAHFDWLVANGFFAPAGGELYAVTDRGRASADLGLYDWEPPPKVVPPPKRPSRKT